MLSQEYLHTVLQLFNIEERDSKNCLVLEDSWIHSYEVVKAQALLLGYILTSYSHRRASVCNIKKINFLSAEEKSVLSFLHPYDVQSFSNLQRYCLLLLLESYTIPVLVSFCPVVVFQVVHRHCSTLVLVDTLEVIRYQELHPFGNVLFGRFIYCY